MSQIIAVTPLLSHIVLAVVVLAGFGLALFLLRRSPGGVK